MEVLGHRELWIGAAMVAVSVLSACGGETSQRTPAPTVVLSPTVDELSTLIAMQQVATEVPTASPWPTPTPTVTPSVTPTPASTDTPTMTPTDMPTTPTPLATNTPRSTQVALQPLEQQQFTGVGEVPDHYWFTRPFPRDPSNRIHDYLSRSYPYGSTGGGQFQVHHGVDIQNPTGTAILAVANGWVVYAGSDAKEQFGPKTDFYGNLVVIEHDYPAPNGQTLYTLYGHMMSVGVESGQRVEQGDKIGQVGSTGVALGAHLHLEVRLGNPRDYGSTYNPDLWLRPWPTFGTLAGRMTDSDGSPVYDTMITLLPENIGASHYAYSYALDTVNPDPILGENYACGDLPDGDYTVVVRIRDIKRFEGKVTIEAGKTSWLDIQLN